MRNETNTYTQTLRLLEVLQEFVETNPNEVPTLADSALLIQAVYVELSRPNPVTVN
jgi:hypothetical protein